MLANNLNKQWMTFDVYVKLIRISLNMNLFGGYEKWV